MIRLAVLALLAATPSFAQSPQATIEARQANFKAIAKAFKELNDELKKSAPSLAVLRTAAADLQKSSVRIAGFFPAGTGPETDLKTDALPAIWRNPAGFTEAARRHTAAVDALVAATRGSDMAAIRTAAGAVGPTCKGCHDSFRKPQS
ncbi:MAG: cytochrome c [Sphingomonadaceae bacterium]|uniref:c-type cytochrome n=1 Tax=Thermaurantiacus sp. TaxID=2820283 RepID=UPI00298EE5C8|nr:cytochrome c [Thermaurantiacus sp.]MCS6987880.1 cytochrome c [Sphingomonadaceae bacterium]MDW8414900.1 cytochrome c [Thermaurantiacus sp.]